MDPEGRTEHLFPEASEEHHEQLAAYGFAARYAGGKKVAIMGGNDVVYGARMIGQTAGSVAGFIVSDGAAEPVSSIHPAPNTTYETAKLPKLPRPDDSLDVVVVLSLVQDLEDAGPFLKEVRRTLKEDGVLILSVPNKGTGAPYVRSGMYAPELEELLGLYFRDVRLYGHGSVSGGVVFPVGGPETDATLERAHFALSDPAPGADVPETRSLLAVCGSNNSEDEPYLLLDRDRRVFEERGGPHRGRGFAAARGPQHARERSPGLPGYPQAAQQRSQPLQGPTRPRGRPPERVDQPK